MEAVCDGQRAEWMEQMSERILHDFDAGAWRDVFLGLQHDQIEFQQQHQTLLCARAPGGWDQAEHQGLADHFRGRCETVRGSELLMAFDQPALALHAATVLHKLAAEPGARASLSTAVCTVVRFPWEGRVQTLTLGPERDHAEALVRDACPGSIALCPETYDLLADRLGTQLRDALVVTELDDCRVLAASIILAPSVCTGGSTFTGLGRS